MEPKPKPVRVTLTCARNESHRWRTKMARVRVEAGYLRWRAEEEMCPRCGGNWALAFDHDDA